MDYRALLKHVEETLLAIDRGADLLSTVANVAEAIVRNFRSELGIVGGRLYVREDSQYVLQRGFGRSRKTPPGIAVPAGYGPVLRAEEAGIVLTDLNDPSVDREFEARLGVERFAAVSFGEEKFLLSFDVHRRVRAEDLLIALGIIRTVLDSKVKSERLEGMLHEARRIQNSILPKSVPSVGDYDVGALTRPAELVGGDFYDFIPLSEQSFGCAIADASGHGLMAALLVRDVYVGLRMGIGGDFKIARAIERLNGILNKSRLVTKFVSLFYGEFERDGEIIYVNAGHPAPLHLRVAGGTFGELDSTGMVLGPSPDAVYGRRALKMEPGDVLLLYTDGIVEAHDKRGREFGIPRLKRLLVELRKRRAKEIAEGVMNAVKAWDDGLAPEDDRTVVVVRRATPPPKSGVRPAFAPPKPAPEAPPGAAAA